MKLLQENIFVGMVYGCISIITLYKPTIFYNAY